MLCYISGYILDLTIVFIFKAAAIHKPQSLVKQSQCVSELSLPAVLKTSSQKSFYILIQTLCVFSAAADAVKELKCVRIVLLAILYNYQQSHPEDGAASG